MCGIIGFNFEDRALAKKMLDLTNHRGPDDRALFVSKGFTLGMNRLSIIDLKKGLYPIHNEEQTLFLVFNGEIYNYLELKSKLEKQGHKFYTNCDAEVIVHLYEEHGQDCVKHLNGMFAIALFDTTNNQLFLARDRLGIKPLYYHFDGQNMIFASEAKNILLLPGFKKTVNNDALAYYLTFRCNSSSETMFKNIHKLKPAHTLIFSKNKIRISKYWDFKIKNTHTDQNQIQQEIITRLKSSIKKRLMSDVPLGAYISGGVDSGSIVSIMSQLSDQPVKTFSVLFEEESEKKLSGARYLAHHYETDHHELVIGDESAKLLPNIVWSTDEPLCDPTCIPTYLLAQESKKKVTVVLTGDGSDEQFAGYEQFRMLLLHYKIARKFPCLARAIIPPLIRKVPKPILNSGFKYASALGDKGIDRFSDFITTNDKSESYLSIVSIFNEKEKFNLLNKYYDNHMKIIKNHFDTSNDYLSQLLRVDLEMMLTEDILMKTDKSTMAWSTEARVPFLDHNLWEYSMQIDSKLKLWKGIDKYILRKSLPRLVPKQITSRKKDRFFVPIDSWLQGEFGETAKQLLSEKEIKTTKVFKPKHIKKILHDFEHSKLYYSRQLWALLCFQMWHKIFFQRDFTKKSSLRF